VALARYLHALYGTAKLHITYVGRCPGASDESIDARMAPEELFALFRERDIVVEEQPPVFDSVIPPNRRRHFSQSGGIPSVESLWSSGAGHTLVEISGEELPIELAQLLLTDAPLLVNAAPALGCVCSGRTAEYDVEEGRALLSSLEPPRSATPIVDTRVAVTLELPLQSPQLATAAPAKEPREAKEVKASTPVSAPPRAALRRPSSGRESYLRSRCRITPISNRFTSTRPDRRCLRFRPLPLHRRMPLAPTCLLPLGLTRRQPRTTRPSPWLER